MVALLRARGVPARHVIGFTREGQDTPKHSWVEVWLDERGWVAFDPTLARNDAAALACPRPMYLRMSTVRVDERLGGFHWFNYRYTEAAAKVTGTLTIGTGLKARTLFAAVGVLTAEQATHLAAQITRWTFQAAGTWRRAPEPW